MKISLAFDVHGTLIDLQKMEVPLREKMGDKAGAFLHTWKNKQREYAFRRRLMEDDVDFALCTSQALDYACLYHHEALKEEEKEAVLAYSRRLPVYEEVAAALNELKKSGYRLFAFSNGALKGVTELLRNAGLEAVFEKIYSVEGTKTFKPDPAVYENFLRYSHTGHQFTWFISGNSFDVIGAKNIGLKVIWVKRSPAKILDPWGVSPDHVVSDLSQLAPYLSTVKNG